MGKSRTLSKTEMKRLMNHLNANIKEWSDKRFADSRAVQARRDLVIFQMLLCGMRIGEVASLTQGEIITGWEKKYPNASEWNGSDNPAAMIPSFKDMFCLKASKTKTKQGRWVHLTKSAKEALADYLTYATDAEHLSEWQSKQGRAARMGAFKSNKYIVEPNAALIQSQKSGAKCMSANSLRQAVNKHFLDCDIPSSSHFGRKQLASLLMEQGVSVYHIQKVLGHGDLRTTSRYIEDLKAETKLDKVIGEVSF